MGLVLKQLNHIHRRGPIKFNFLKKNEYLKNQKSILDEIKSIFYYFLEGFLWIKFKKIEDTTIKYITTCIHINTTLIIVVWASWKKWKLDK